MGFHNKCIFSLALKVCLWWLLFDKLELTIDYPNKVVPRLLTFLLSCIDALLVYPCVLCRRWTQSLALELDLFELGAAYVIWLYDPTWRFLNLNRMNFRRKVHVLNWNCKVLRTKRSQLNQIFYPHLLTSSLMSLSSSSPVCGTLARQVKVPALLLETSLMRRPSLSITYWSPAPIQRCVLKC